MNETITFNLYDYAVVLAIVSAIVIGLFLLVMFIIEKRRKSKAKPGVYIAGINHSDSAINNEMRVGVLERVVEYLISNSDEEIDMDKIRAEALEALRERYPDCGIELVEKEK